MSSPSHSRSTGVIAPTGPFTTAHVTQILVHLRLDWLLHHMPPRLVWATYVLLNGFFTIALLALLGVATHSPFVFPSLGPTAYLFFFNPLSEASSPRNTILGHAIGLICGFGAFHLAAIHAPCCYPGPSIYWSRILAAGLSLSFTGALMVLLRVTHPPAGATTLIVSLGILSTGKDVAVIELAVILLTVQALVINRLAGLPYPLWHAVIEPQSTPHQ